MTIPTEEDWGDYRSDLDQEYAHDLFAGRSREDMLPHFRANPIEATDELRFMPEAPFRYYMLCFRDAVMAWELEESYAADAASCFLGLILQKLERDPACIAPIMPELRNAIDYVARNQSAFGADEEIYGSFLQILDRIRALDAAHEGS